MRYPTLALVFALMLSLCSQVVFAENNFSVSAGTEYTIGSYGDTVDTEIWYFPFTMKYETDFTTIKLTVPYIYISGPANVVGGAGEPIQISGTPGEQRSESGMGDVVASGSFNLYAGGGAYGMLIDLVGKIKFGTADENKGLGTGENDYAVQIDIVKSFNLMSIFGSVGKKRLGDPPDIELENPAYASIGAAVKFTTETSGGIVYDYRQRSVDGGAPISEATVFASYKLTAATKLQGYVVKGFSDGSPDRGVGIMFISIR